MRKTTQTVEIEVEGPDEHGRYSPDGFEGFYYQDTFTGPHREAVDKHIASAPKVEEFEGFLVGYRESIGDYAVWLPGDRENAEKGEHPRVISTDLEGVWRQVQEYSAYPETRKYVPALIALAHYLEEKGL